MSRPITLDRLSETEYVELADPAYTRQTPFGTFYHHPEFPTRHDANQLMRTVLPAGVEPVVLLDHLEELYSTTSITYHKMSGHDPTTFERLKPLFPEDRRQICWTLVLEREPERHANPDIIVEPVTSKNEADLDDLHRNAEGRISDGHRFARAQEARIGGEWVIGYVDRRPASSSGWFIVDGIARFRGVNTKEWAQNQGAATTMIHYVQNHPVVQAQDALTIFCTDEGPLRVYEELGFVKRGWMWELSYDRT